ncbi:N-acetylneuraminate synthase family protein [Gammaproteobacteria bacterium]|nr:N-acetylneuraminate synthase family protein [Gammaproteobacteria bacterium]
MKIDIDKFDIGSRRCFVIAEIGNNHNGSFVRAKKMIDMASDFGADCVKFQLRNMSEVYRKKTLKKDGEDLGTEYVLDLLDRFQLTFEEQKELSEYCKKKGLLYLCTPWDTSSVEMLNKINVPAYKVASADLTNLPLLNSLCETHKPLILSTGMSTEAEIKTTVNYLNKRSAQFVLLHCNSTYPAPFHDINLEWMHSLKKIHPLIGYSGHERGIAVSLAARAFGACVIERHFTLDRNMEGPDHAASLESKEFADLVRGIREIEEAIGQGNKRNVSQGEMINRENLGKSLVANRNISIGDIIESSDIKVRSPGQGISPQYFEDLIGKKILRNMKEEDFFFPSDLNENRIEPKDYNFDHKWGVPVRYHDFSEYSNKINPDLYEFHLSYSDLDLDISKYIKDTYDCDFVVHAPELFSESRLMDLANPDDEYRNDSIKETQRVIDITRNLKKYFPKTKKPLIVANIGGFSMDAPLNKNEMDKYYDRFQKSLEILDMDGVELIPQTMAPFPWHFGGQRYQNMFLHIEDIMTYCKKLGLRMCFDISHARLACNHFEIDFYDYAKKIAPFTAHIHLGDALGVNGEGLQIGDGDIDFKKLNKILLTGCPNASFIPEIWQGHKNGGEGFWIALEKLENLIKERI